MKIIDCIQGSPEWKVARLGIPTASEFSRLVTSMGERSKSLEPYARELASEIFADKTMSDFDGNMWSDRGRDLEQAAIELYEFTHDCVVQRVGFITTDDGLTGGSPDGLLGDDAGIEVKCLKAERHLDVLQKYQATGKTPPDYVAQVQGYMYVTGRSRWVLMLHHPDLPPIKISVAADPYFHKALAAGVAAVIAERDAVLASLRGTT